jgi:hypothetical protein
MLALVAAPEETANSGLVAVRFDRPAGQSVVRQKEGMCRVG